MDEQEIELLVKQIQVVDTAWHLHQEIFGAQTAEARALRTAKDHLQHTLLAVPNADVELVRDGTTEDDEPTYLLRVRLNNRTLTACHMPERLLPGPFTHRGDWAAGDADQLHNHSTMGRHDRTHIDVPCGKGSE